MIYKIIGTIFIAILLPGCTTIGSTELDSIQRNDLERKIVKNRSTMNDVLEIIGDPTSTKINSKNTETWTYDFSSSRKTIPSYIPLIKEFSRGVTNKSKKLTIYFNENKIVKNYTYSSKNLQKNSGFLH